jgi:hypothetical protein
MNLVNSILIKNSVVVRTFWLQTSKKPPRLCSKLPAREKRYASSFAFDAMAERGAAAG